MSPSTSIAPGTVSRAGDGLADAHRCGSVQHVGMVVGERVERDGERVRAGAALEAPHVDVVVASVDVALAVYRAGHDLTDTCRCSSVQYVAMVVEDDGRGTPRPTTQIRRVGLPCRKHRGVRCPPRFHPPRSRLARPATPVCGPAASAPLYIMHLYTSLPRLGLQVDNRLTAVAMVPTWESRRTDLRLCTIGPGQVAAVASKPVRRGFDSPQVHGQRSTPSHDGNRPGGKGCARHHRHRSGSRSR